MILENKKGERVIVNSKNTKLCSQECEYEYGRCKRFKKLMFLYDWRDFIYYRCQQCLDEFGEKP